MRPSSKKYGIEVQYFRGGSSDVTSKVLAEADAGRPQADMVDASDLAALLLMKERGLLKPFKSPAMDAVAKELRDPDGTWITDRLTQAVIQYNTKEFGATPPVDLGRSRQGRMNGRLVYFSSPNGDGAPRLYTLAKHLGWDLLKVAGRDQAAARADPAGHHASAGARRTWRGLPAERQHRLALQAAGQADRLRIPGRGRANRDRSLRPAQELDAAARRRPVLRVVDGRGGPGDPGQGRQVLEPHRRRAAEGSTPLSKLKLLTLDYAEYKKNKAKILDQMAGIFGGEWGN